MRKSKSLSVASLLAIGANELHVALELLECLHAATLIRVMHEAELMVLLVYVDVCGGGTQAKYSYAFSTATCCCLVVFLHSANLTSRGRPNILHVHIGSKLFGEGRRRKRATNAANGDADESIGRPE